MKRFSLIFSMVMILSLLLAACGTPAPQETPAGPTEIGPVTIWTKFNDTNPQNTQDQWLAATIKSLAGFEGLEVTNIFAPYDQINNKLNLAVQSGGDIPDLSYIDTPIDYFYQNKVLMDITDYVKSAPWYADISPAAMKACTGPDGKIYCVPATEAGHVLYYWTSAYPNGAPKTTDDLLTAGEKMKMDGKYAITFKGSETTGASTFYLQMIYSFGGKYTDENGNTVWASDATVKAIELIRALFANKYAPDVCLAPGFDFETPFKDGSAGAFVAGSWSYVYLNPLTSFDGASTFDFGAQSVEEAMKAGALKIADTISAPGGKPYSILYVNAWAIPVGAKNVEGAKAVIDYLMTPRNNADYAVAYGALPVNLVSLKDPRFVDSLYWQAVSNALNSYGVVLPVNKNQKWTQKVNDTIVTLIQNPGQDIMEALKKAQDDLNAGN